MPYTASVTTLLAILVVLGQIGAVLLVGALLLRRNETAKKMVSFVGHHAYQIAFVVAFVSTAGSLLYSEIAGYNPCKMCWIQRIFMYPQVLILAIGDKYKDRMTSLHALTLSGFGAVIAGYHYLLQLGIVPELSCGAVGFSESCSKRFVMTFGYVTIPMMALTGFLMIFVAMLAYRKTHRV